jgi:hypothetical protein
VRPRRRAARRSASRGHSGGGFIAERDLGDAEVGDGPSWSVGPTIKAAQRSAAADREATAGIGAG